MSLTAKYLHKLPEMKTAFDDAFRRGPAPVAGSSEEIAQGSGCETLRVVPQRSKQQNRPQVEESTRERPVLRLRKFT
jgi:hypothetical protein